jgi:IS30 family transposase
MESTARRPRGRFVQITLQERMYIRSALTERRRVRDIANVLGKHRSTIFREVKRNTNAGGLYDARHAQAFLRRRRLAAREKFRIIDNDPQLQMELERLFNNSLSPEQIVGYIGRAGHMRKICRQAIYEWVHREWQTRKTYLRFKGRPRVKYGEKKNSWQPQKRHISERPAIVEKRRRTGDWEGDLVHGCKDDSRHALLTLVDRATGLNIVWKVQTLNARVMAHIIEIALRRFPVHTITFDNGFEFGQHKTMEELIGCKVYFTDVNSPEQRGSNENFNGLLREFFPKGKSLAHVTQAEVDRVSDILNRRPRKRLGFECPRDVFAQMSGMSKYILRRPG